MDSSEVTGRALKVGDVVRHAVGSPRVDGRARALAAMVGAVVAVLPGASSGPRKSGARPYGKVRVLWSSGSVGVHDACMVVKAGAK